jgi:hypothetical protein
MKVVKKSTIALISVILMLSIVGYINYKYNPQREQNLGQTVYVNGKDSFTYENVSIYDDENEDLSNDDESQEDDSIAVFKYDRDNMYSELNENYSNIIANVNSSKEQIEQYQNKLDELIQEKNLITMVENVIKSRGIENIVIIPTNNDNINVVVESKENIENDKIAQIQQIIVDQLGTDANKISIIVK